MSILVERFRAAMKKEDIRMSREATCEVGYPTGFLALDFSNSQTVHVKKENGEEFSYVSLGIVDGSMNGVIGRSGCGKSSFISQVAAEIVKPFKTSCIFEDNIECGMTTSRRMKLTGMNEKELEERFIIRNQGVTAENFYRRIKMIHDMKLAEPDKYMYDTGLLDHNGKPIRLFEPTVYILDSLPMLMPEKYAEEDEISGGMSTTATAKVVTQIIRTMIPMLKTANIILFVVNHIMQDVQINPMMHSKTQLAYLKQGERLPRGGTAIYLSNFIIRLDDNTKLKPDEKFKVAGNYVDITFVKSRSNRPNCGATLLYSFEDGFDKILSLYLYLKNETKRINGAGVGMYVDDHTDKKFSMGNFKEKFIKDKEFRDIFLGAVQEELMKSVNKADSKVSEEEEDICEQSMSSIYSNLTFSQTKSE